MTKLTLPNLMDLLAEAQAMYDVQQEREDLPETGKFFANLTAKGVLEHLARATTAMVAMARNGHIGASAEDIEEATEMLEAIYDQEEIRPAPKETLEMLRGGKEEDDDE